MTEPITGGCRCGQLRYTVERDPIASVVCHCEGCRRRTGVSTGVMFVPRLGCAIDGDHGSYLDPSTTTPIRMMFCTTCGSTIAATAGRYPDVLIVLAASLDDTRRFTPLFHMWVSKKPHWVGIDDDLPRFSEHPDWEQVGGEPDLGTVLAPHAP